MESAVKAAVAVAGAHGVRCDDPVVLRAAWHVLVHLQPAPVVARVTSGVPDANPLDVSRELSVARHARRAPVVSPSDLLDPGPHEHGGHTLVFWRFLEERGELDVEAAGLGLRAIHDALADYGGELPSAGRRDEVHAMLAPLGDSADTDLLRRLVESELPNGQALHGDAHLFNCMATAGGPIWHDFETACSGPREYDLAALVLRHRSRGDHPEAMVALAAYGEHDADLLEAALPVYAAWVTASLLSASVRRPAAAEAAERYLRFLRAYRR